MLSMNINPIRTQQFCDLYWQRTRNAAQISQKEINHISHQWNLSNINCYLLGSKNAVLWNANYRDIPEIIRNTDTEFRYLRPTKEDLILWRGVAKPIDDIAYINDVFNKSMNLKKGDLIRLPGYIFADSNIKTAKEFGQISTNSAILYKINAPAGSRIYRSGCFIFPRDSKFVCTDNITMSEKNKPYQLISLDYIKPET